MQISSLSAISFCWQLLSMCKTVVWCSPICLFLLLFLSFEETYSKNTTKTDVNYCTDYIFSRSFIVSNPNIYVFNPFWVYFCMFWESSPVFPTVYSCFICHRLIDHVSVGLFPSNPLCSIDICMSVFLPVSYYFNYIAL